jgi:GT2 family glycosyltransferase
MPECSVLLPSWNGVEYLARCVASIGRECEAVELELIAVDNASTDGAAELLRQLETEHTWIRCVYNSSNLLFARACNQAYDLSSAPWVLVVNNDVEVLPGTLRKLLDYGEAHPDVGVVTPRFVLPDGTNQEAYRRLPTTATVLAHYHRLGRALDRLLLGGRPQSRYFCRDLVLEGVVDVEQAGASCSLFRRTALDSVGGLFDERFPLLFNDVDLSARLRRRGWRSVVLTETYVLHHDGVASAAMPRPLYRRHQFDGMFSYMDAHDVPGRWLLIAALPHRWLSWRRRTRPPRPAAGSRAASDPASRP